MYARGGREREREGEAVIKLVSGDSLGGATYELHVYDDPGSVDIRRTIMGNISLCVGQGGGDEDRRVDAPLRWVKVITVRRARTQRRNHAR